MRATMYAFLTAQASLLALAPLPRWYGAGAVIDTPTKPFVVLRWLAPVPGDAHGSFANQLRVDFHEPRGSYSRGDAFRKAIRPILESVFDLAGSDGRITQCDYLGHSGDQEDPDYGTNYTFTSWQVIGVQT